MAALATGKFITQGSRILSSNLQDCIIQDSIAQRFEVILHPHHQSRTTSWRHQRTPRRPGRRRAPTPEELRQATVTPASKLYGPPRVHFSAPLDHLTKTAKIRGATGTYSTIPHPARCRNLAKPLLYQDPINLVLSPHLCVFHSHSAPYPENCL
jgi:hypothetical protein